MLGAYRSLLRPATALATATGAAMLVNRQRAECEERGVSPAVHLELEKLRPGQQAMYKKWEEDEEKWHLLPPRAWPPYQPKADELPALKKAAAKCPPVDSSNLSPECVQAHFDLATCLAFNTIDAGEGLRMYRALAERGHVSSMVAIGIVQLDGIGCEVKEASTADGIKWMQLVRLPIHSPQIIWIALTPDHLDRSALRSAVHRVGRSRCGSPNKGLGSTPATAQACSKGDAQAQYEIGCLHYLGSAPQLVTPDESELSQYAS